MLAPNPMVVTSWPIPGDVADLNAIIDAQAQAVEDQEALLHAYQLVLNAAQNPAPGAASTAVCLTQGGASTTLTVGTVTGPAIANGSVVTGGVALSTPPLTVLGQISGTVGQSGSYLISAAINQAVGATMTFTPPAPAPGTGWPVPQDAPTLDLIAQQLTAIIRTQTALIQHYQDVLNTSQTPAPPTGP